MNEDIIKLGWDGHFESHFGQYRARELRPARIITQERDRYTVEGETGTCLAEVSGKFRHEVMDESDFPAVGDWVALAGGSADGPGIIHAVLPRKSALVRKKAGRTTEGQVMAANMDTVFIVMGLDRDFNLRRMERYLTLIWESGAAPAVILNKADICENAAEKKTEAEEMAFGVPVLPVSAATGHGLDALEPFTAAGKTILMVGSSGVGKSSLINRMTGSDAITTGAVRETDGRGRHTTTHRELVFLPAGGMIIDTPGIREVGLWVDPDRVDESFDEIAGLAADCRFADCTHVHEPGCAVRRAVEDGELDSGRYENYLKLRKESEYLATKQDKRAQLNEKARQKEFGRMVKRIVKEHNKRKGRG